MTLLSEIFPVIKPLLVGEKKHQILEHIRTPIRKLHDVQVVMNDKEHTDSSQLIDIKLENNIVKAYYEGLQEPFFGIPDETVVRIVAMYKRLFILMASSFARQNIVGKGITFLALLLNKDILPDWLSHIFEAYPIRLQDQYYIPCVKEIKRVLTGRMNETYVNAIIAILENDNAYRHRLQDILPLLDKAQLRGYKRTRNEIRRLLGILTERELQESMPFKYNAIDKLTLLLLIPRIRKVVIDILNDIDIEKVKMTKEDIYFTNRYMIYKCRGLSREDRQKENIKKYGVL